MYVPGVHVWSGTGKRQEAYHTQLGQTLRYALEPGRRTTTVVATLLSC